MIQTHMMPDGRAIAYRHTPGTGPTIVFLPGYMSDMAGSKASAVFDWAAAGGRACLLMDYSGCGQSPGTFADGTLSRWRDEVLALIAAHVAGPVVLVGSSMGGWLMLLVARAIPDRIAGLVGIAAAPDFTAWGYSEGQKAELAAGHTILEPNPYGPEPTPTHAAFWADGQSQLQLDAPIPIDAPVRLLHGIEDGDVPPAIGHRLLGALRSGDVQLTLVKGGDHRLSRDEDIALLLRTLASFAD
ncbi:MULTISPECIES: alpha/beta fold hydrolase [unclassified Novosphingobium]|uniref:alpha/beta fold hydrolase n=1 Tax=unclassified Novosphingobium TaxID=2644732 RepID=UPI00086BA878|nr:MULTISPECIES: alpha/beta hydrolase [unclassified Novosphingobium]MBN9142580.1 alpha/beta hydrolase [Novosphingobium sp.]MDR6705661.1 pimeloyl-ACP methyl ester carboxylesterase [Novosphingobium sp. 1748]ODU79903.1 MAG: alpha/beta hydrolase [Novosphingobium sp. SCN 63-17]OJX89001.1 MAG: alpha/beta hydrolase [Novosphingobium sp. 63-713]